MEAHSPAGSRAGGGWASTAGGGGLGGGTPPPSPSASNRAAPFDRARPRTAGSALTGSTPTSPAAARSHLSTMLALAAGQQSQPTGRPSAASGPVMPEEAPRSGVARKVGDGGASRAAAAPLQANDRLGAVRANIAALSEIVSAAGSGGGGGNAAVAARSGPPAQLVPRQGQIVLSEDRVASIHTEASRIEQHLALEVKRRAEADKALQQLIEARAREMAQDIEQKANEKIIKLHHLVDSLTRQVDTLDSELSKEREKNVRLTQELRYHATQGVDDVKKSVDHERRQRQEKEALLSKKLTEDMFRLQERLDVERHARESMLTAIREEIVSLGSSRAKSDEKFLAKLRLEIGQLKKAVAAEQDQRERGEEQLAATMDEVVQQVHAGLRALAQR